MTLQQFKELVGTWAVLRHTTPREFNGADMRNFIGMMNDRTRQFVSILETQDPEFYSAIAELATNAATLTTPGARIIGDGRNMTDV